MTEPTRTAQHEAACLAWGWLWHAASLAPEAHRAREALRAHLSRGDLRHGIQLAQAAGARASALTWLSRRMDVLTLARISRHRDLNILLASYYREAPEDISRRI